MDTMKLGMILQTLGEHARYHVYLTSDIEKLSIDKQIIGIANSYQDACKVISSYLRDMDIDSDKYWRILMGSDATFIDFGSWSQFMAIVPPVPKSEIMGEKE